MSCRSTSGGSASTSLARAVSGLNDSEIQQVFHALKREGADVRPPSELDLHAWRERQYELIERSRSMSQRRRDELRQRLFRSRSEPTPDGGTFYAWSRVEARARQEKAIRAIPDAVDLAAAGSQREQYELDREGKPARVWYASYGSNLHRDRFLTYIRGGTPEGSTRSYDGCLDPTVPEDDIAIRVPGARPHFALTSRVWSGGIAFIDAAKGETATGLGRAYNVSRDQFEDVVAQENGLFAGMCSDIDYADVLNTGRLVTGRGPYETLLHIGDHDGAPVLTFTAPFSTRDALGRKGSVTRSGVRLPVLTNKPSVAYVRMIGSGLNETFGMDEVAQADYLRGCPGGDRYSRQELVQILRNRDSTPAEVSATTALSTGASTGRKAPAETDTYTGEIIYTKRAVDPNPPATPSRFVPRRPTQTSTRSGSGRTGSGRTGSASPGSSVSRGTGVATTNPKKRGFYSSVKTYTSGEAQAAGVRYWASELDEAQRMHALREEIVARGPALSGDESLRRHEARVAHCEDSRQKVAELAAKHEYAKSQSPTRWYAGNSRNQQEWAIELNNVRRLIEAEERIIEVEMAMSASGGIAGVVSDGEMRQQRQERVDACLGRVAVLKSRLAEIETYLR